MNLENEIKESPLEKAKRLKAEKESKDQSKAEDETKKQAEIQARTEKLGALNNSKQDLENQLNEINSKLEASRNEAHETRDTMKEGGLDKDEEFKGEYDSTISEVAGNLNELRNERNIIKTELEQINSNIENFDVNEVVTEGKEATQGAVENVKQENEEAITQVENYPGAETNDIKMAENITAETSKEANQIKENADKQVNKTTPENNFTHALKNANEKFQKLEQDIDEAKSVISEVKSMEAGSHEKQHAAVDMRHKVEDISFYESTLKVFIEHAEDGNKQEIQEATQKMEDCKTKLKEIKQEAMIVWWEAKGQNEGGESAELSKDYTEIVKTNITPERAEQLLTSESLSDSGKEYVATELMKKFMAEGRDKDVFNIVALGRKDGFYKTMNMDSLNSDFVKSIKYKDKNLYEKAKSLLGPNTQPYA